LRVLFGQLADSAVLFSVQRIIAFTPRLALMPLVIVARADKRSNKTGQLPLLAQSGHADRAQRCLLLGEFRVAL
jgi:hypothetical protein